jgi:hypothetical protein
MSCWKSSYDSWLRIPDYVVYRISNLAFLAMSFLTMSSKIFHFSFLAMSSFRFLAMSFLAIVWHRASYSIRIAHVPKFFVAARCRKRKKLFLYCHYSYSNRVEHMIKATDCNELENLAEFYIFIWGTVPGGDEDSWANKLYSSRMQI